MERKYLGFNNRPFLAYFIRKRSPYLLTHRHVFRAEGFELERVPLVVVLAVREALVALAAGVGGLGWEVCALDLAPVLAGCTGGHQLSVVLW